MSYAPHEFQLSLYGKLTADSTLMALITGVYDYVPQNQAFPFITIGDVAWNDRSSHTTDGYTGDFTIHVWTEAHGRKTNYAIQKRIDELINTGTITISGWNNLSMRRTLTNTLVEADTLTVHGVCRYRIYIGNQ